VGGEGGAKVEEESKKEINVSTERVAEVRRAGVGKGGR
jgi:hypothetical protein